PLWAQGGALRHGRAGAGRVEGRSARGAHERELGPARGERLSGAAQRATATGTGDSATASVLPCSSRSFAGMEVVACSPSAATACTAVVSPWRSAVIKPRARFMLR